MKKYKKNKNFNKNQNSFYFEDFLETNKKDKIFKKNNTFQDRIYLLFFLFFSLIFIFSIRIIHVSLNSVELSNQENFSYKYFLQRRDIVDRNGSLISRNIKSFHAAINPNLVKNKENLLIKLKLNFPELPIKMIEKKLKSNKYFYLKKRINQKEKEILWSFGEKGVIFEPFADKWIGEAEVVSYGDHKGIEFVVGTEFLVTFAKMDSIRFTYNDRDLLGLVLDGSYNAAVSLAQCQELVAEVGASRKSINMKRKLKKPSSRDPFRQ